MLIFEGNNGGAYSEPDECHQNDLQYFPVLQHFRKDDLPLCQGHQSDDHHLQGLHHAWCQQDLGYSSVGAVFGSLSSKMYIFIVTGTCLFGLICLSSWLCSSIFKLGFFI